MQEFFSQNIIEVLPIKPAHTSERIMIFDLVTIENDADYGFIHPEGLLTLAVSHYFLWLCKCKNPKKARKQQVKKPRCPLKKWTTFWVS